MNHPGAPGLERLTVVANERITEGVGLIALRAPRCASTVLPGQFVHLRIARGSALLLRRPFSIHRVSGENIEILYQVLGAGTLQLAERQPGDTSMDLVGPLGSGWRVLPGMSRALLVAGGLGVAPLGMLAEELAQAGVNVSVAIGAPTRDRLLATELFDAVARQVELATDDGSTGHHGFVTALSASLLSEERFDVVYCCGPQVMQRIVAAQAAAAGVAAQVSLERLMACGIGACLSCVVSTTNGLKRACVDGPVFDAVEVSWSDAELPPRH